MLEEEGSGRKGWREERMEAEGSGRKGWREESMEAEGSGRKGWREESMEGGKRKGGSEAVKERYTNVTLQTENHTS